MTSSTSTYELSSINESKLMAHNISHIHGKQLLQQKLIFTQNDNKTQGTSSYIRLMIQAYESLWGSFGSCGLKS